MPFIYYLTVIFANKKAKHGTVIWFSQDRQLADTGTGMFFLLALCIILVGVFHYTATHIDLCKLISA